MPANLRADLKNLEAVTGLDPQIYTSETQDDADRLAELLAFWDSRTSVADFQQTICFAIITAHRTITEPVRPIGLGAWEDLDDLFQQHPVLFIQALAEMQPADLVRHLPPCGDAFTPVGYAAMLHLWGMPGDRGEQRRRLKAFGRPMSEHPDARRVRVIVAHALGITVAIRRVEDEEEFSMYPPEQIGAVTPALHRAVENLLRGVAATDDRGVTR